MEQRPYPVEPMRSSTIVGRSFSTYFRNFKSIAIFILIFNGIISLAGFISNEIFMSQTVDITLKDLLYQILTGNIDAMDSFMAEFNQWRASTRIPSWISILTVTASLFITPLVSGGIAYITTGYFLGEKHTPGKWFRLVGSKYKSLFITHICTILLLIGLGIALTIVYTFLIVMFSLTIVFLSPFIGVLLLIASFLPFLFILLFLTASQSVSYAVVVREDISGFKPIIRSIKLCFTRFWRTVGLSFLISLTVVLCTFAASFLFGLILNIFGADNTVVSRLFNNVIVPLLFNPLTMIAFCLHYVSLRIENEGYLVEPIPAPESIPEDDANNPS